MVEVSHHTDYALEAYYIVAPAEASSNLARYDGIAYGYRCHHPSIFKTSILEPEPPALVKKYFAGLF